MQVLAVDDDEISLMLLEHAVRSAGYKVRTANSVASALDILSTTECRLVISDWDMPGASGLDLCRSVRAADLSNYTYFILLTARNSADETVEGLAAGADDFIAKPFHPEELIERIRVGERILSLETRDVAIFALAKLAESRDSDTGAHLERVQSYSRVLAQQLAGHPDFRDQIDAEFIRLIYLTSPLHDIGKVGVPDSVLRKPGRLTDQEFAIMQEHVRIGAETLQAALDRFPSAKFLRMARDIAATHHERWDGSGYPARLSGRNIPLCGRIVALADVYDALTSRRVYKEAFEHDRSRMIIINEAGRHFDPVIVEAFVEVEDKFIEIAQRFAEGQASALCAVHA